MPVKGLREVHAPAYQNIGLPGAFAIALMNLPLSRAEKAMDEGDVIEEFKPMKVTCQSC